MFPDYKESLFFFKSQQGFRGHGGSLKYEGLLLGGCRAEDGLGVFLTRLWTARRAEMTQRVLKTKDRNRHGDNPMERGR